MVESDKLEIPQGNPLFSVNFRAISESLAGWGVVSNGDFRVNAGSGSLEIDVDSGVMFSDGEEYEHGSPTTKTLSAGDSSSDRWDTVYFDTAASDDSVSPSVGVHEGTPEQYPEPPDVTGDEVLLAMVYVPTGATAVESDAILNWITHCQRADGVRVEDPDDVYQNVDLESVLSELQSKVSDRSGKTVTVSSDYTTDGEGTVFVDTASASSSVTVTLASSDLTDGVDVSIIDVGGEAEDKSISIIPEGTETIDDEDSVLIVRSYGSKSVTADGQSWWTVGGSGLNVTTLGEGLSFQWEESGEVHDGDTALVNTDALENGESVEIKKVSLTTESATAVSSGVDLKFVTFDGSGGFTEQGTIVAGDGNTIYDGTTGSPLYSYTNTTGSKQTIGVAVVNESGGSETVVVSVKAGDLVDQTEITVNNKVEVPFFRHEANDMESLKPPLDGANIVDDGNGYATLKEVTETAAMGTYSNTVSGSDRRGVVVETNEEVGGFDVEVGSETTANKAYIVDHSEATVVTSETFDGGSTVSLTGPFSGGNKYRVVVDSEGSSYTCDRDGSASYPYETTGFTVESGVRAGTTSSTVRFAITNLTGVKMADTGECLIAAIPNDGIAEWSDAIARGAENEGEIMNEIVEVDDNGDVVRSIDSNDSGRFDISSVSTGINLGLRTTLSSASYEKNQPKVFLMVIRWVI